MLSERLRRAIRRERFHRIRLEHNEVLRSAQVRGVDDDAVVPLGAQLLAEIGRFLEGVKPRQILDRDPLRILESQVVFGYSPVVGGIGGIIGEEDAEPAGGMPGCVAEGFGFEVFGPEFGG